MSRRSLAKAVGFHDEYGGIPDARWMRAMTFERLVRDARFASEVATTAVGRLELDRPPSVVIANARVNVDRTAQLLEAAHQRAVDDGAATMLHGLAVPFVGFENERATDVKPDFAVVAPQTSNTDEKSTRSWLIMGDAKDYERVRSRIDDARLLKGFLQVALGAESARSWSQLPVDMDVHDFGALAVPRNVFLQPEALVEDLSDHREEVRMRVAERRREASSVVYDEDHTPVLEHVRHLRATFDPATCASCTLFSFCRNELRSSKEPTDLLVEIGVPVNERPLVGGLVDGGQDTGHGSPSTRARVLATVRGIPVSTGQARIDQAGTPGTVNVVIAKSDSAALGVYGIATQRVSLTGSATWQTTVFDDPQSSATRRSIMRILGKDLTAVMKDRRRANPAEPEPVHLVVPDKATGDVLASIADNLAGIELSRLRWTWDKHQGRTPLTFDGAEAQIPPALTEGERTAVSFLLEEDRARSLSLRSPVIDLRATLARHLVVGGPEVSSLRLDYLVSWGAVTPSTSIDHRSLSDSIEGEDHTPGARLTNRRSNAIHLAFVGARGAVARPANPAEYDSLVRDELHYKTECFDTALAALARFTDSKLRSVYRAIEGDAQCVWRRRLTLHASDLVRFGRTYRHWRNSLVPAIEADSVCAKQLLALANPQAALESARDAGTRDLAAARVTSVSPIVVEIDSRRIGDGDRIVLLHVNGSSCVEEGTIDVKFQKGSFRLTGLSLGPLSAAGAEPRLFEWKPGLEPNLNPGDELVVANVAWFSKLQSNTQLNVDRPKPDEVSAPKVDCSDATYADDPIGHQYCCRPHESAEAEWADTLAGRRARGELNPQVWPPVVDSDAFEVSAADDPVGVSTEGDNVPAPEDATLDDLE